MKPLSDPSPLFAEALEPIRSDGPAGPVVDLACGRGRHALAAARAGLATVALDRDEEALRELAVRADALPVRPVRSDVETVHGLPLRAGSCRAVLVFRFLFRPLAPALAALLRPGGWLAYETFTTAQTQLGYGPRRSEFLLAPDELPGLFPDLEVVSYWEGRTDGDRHHSQRRFRSGGRCQWAV